jgi:beta-barrel assembly-enhancing protease
MSPPFARKRQRLIWPQALALSALLMALPLGLQAGATDRALPTLGDANSQSLSPMAERKLGDRIMRSILSDPDVVDDPLVLEYLQTVWTSLLQSARQRGDIDPEMSSVYAWSPFLVRDKSVNAFALPGGYIGVHLGLLAMTRTPEELASVLAHEMSHVTQRHIARMMSQAKQTSWVGMATMVLGALAMSRNPQGAQALIMGGQGLAAQGQLNFSRDMEREADRVGFGVMSEAGYDPLGMMQMFEALQQASRLNDDNSYPYLRTHPLTTERIGEARSRLGLPGGSTAPPVAPGAATDGARLSNITMLHAMMSARARVLMDTRAANLQALLKPPAPGKDMSALAQLARQYASLSAAIELKDREAAERAIAQAQGPLGALPQAWRADALRLIVLGDIESRLATGRAASAQALLTEALARGELRPGRPETMLRARVALSLPESREQATALSAVTSELTTHLSTREGDIAAWSLAASLWSRQGQALRAIRCEAEATALAGDLQGAIERVDGARKRFAQATGADLIELSVLDARQARWKQTLKDDAREDLP